MDRNYRSYIDNGKCVEPNEQRVQEWYSLVVRAGQGQASSVSRAPELALAPRLARAFR
jgi:hypothetical protein